MLNKLYCLAAILFLGLANQVSAQDTLNHIAVHYQSPVHQYNHKTLSKADLAKSRVMEVKTGQNLAQIAKDSLLDYRLWENMTVLNIIHPPVTYDTLGRPYCWIKAGQMVVLPPMPAQNHSVETKPSLFQKEAFEWLLNTPHWLLLVAFGLSLAFVLLLLWGFGWFFLKTWALRIFRDQFYGQGDRVKEVDFKLSRGSLSYNIKISGQRPAAKTTPAPTAKPKLKEKKEPIQKSAAKPAELTGQQDQNGDQKDVDQKQ